MPFQINSQPTPALPRMCNTSALAKFSAMVCLLLLASCTSNKEIDFKLYDEITHAEEMMSYFEDLALDTSGLSETASITKYFDGSWDLEYEYDNAEDPRFDAMYYSITIESVRTSSEARQTFGFTKTALKAGNRLFGTTSQEVEGMYLPGDQNYYATLHNELGQIGILYVTRHGTVVYSLILSGVYAEDHYILEEIILPELDKLGSFERKQ